VTHHHVNTFIAKNIKKFSQEENRVYYRLMRGIILIFYFLVSAFAFGQNLPTSMFGYELGKKIYIKSKDTELKPDGFTFWEYKKHKILKDGRLAIGVTPKTNKVYSITLYGHFGNNDSAAELSFRSMIKAFVDVYSVPYPNIQEAWHEHYCFFRSGTRLVNIRMYRSVFGLNYTVSVYLGDSELLETAKSEAVELILSGKKKLF